MVQVKMIRRAWTMVMVGALGAALPISAGSTVGHTYTTGLATAAAGEGVDLTDPAAWTRLGCPIQNAGPYNGEMQLGTGHGMWSEDGDGNLL